MRRALSVAAAGLLAGCSTTAGLDGMKGQPLDAAIAKLGYPSEEQAIAGHHLYLWRRSVLVPQVSDPAVRAGCVLTLEVDGNARILAWRWQGELVACNHFAWLTAP